MNSTDDFDRGLKAANRAQALADVTEMVFDLRVKVAQLEDVAAQLQASLRGTEYSADETNHFFQPIRPTHDHWDNGPVWPFVLALATIALLIACPFLWTLR